MKEKPSLICLKMIDCAEAACYLQRRVCACVDGWVAWCGQSPGGVPGAVVLAVVLGGVLVRTPSAGGRAG